MLLLRCKVTKNLSYVQIGCPYSAKEFGVPPESLLNPKYPLAWISPGTILSSWSPDR